MTGIARVNTTQQTHFYRKRINYNDNNAATGIFIGTLPGPRQEAPQQAAPEWGALVVNVYTVVKQAFNAGTTNVITIGTNATAYNNLVAAGTITPGTLGGYNSSPAITGLVAITADTDVYATYTQTGTAATAGQADIVVEYIPDTDL